MQCRAVQSSAAVPCVDNCGNASLQTCGIVGTKYLLEALTRHGRVDVALQLAQVETFPGWVYMYQQVSVAA